MNIALVTSLSPRNIEKQSAAVQSWKATGWPIVSLNAAEEVDAVRAAFADVKVEPVDKNAMQVIGRPLVMLDSIWDFARRSPQDAICVLNSDLLLRDADAVGRVVDRPFDVLFGSRLDVKEASDTHGTAYDGGFDYFFIRRERAAEYPSSLFCLGSPWWDFWVPMVAIGNRWNVLRSQTPLFAHVAHEVKWNMAEHARLGLEFAQVLLNTWRKDTARDAGENDYRDIFANYFFSRMLVLREDLQRGGSKAAAHELLQTYAPVVGTFLRNASTPI
jgi:hypothetical protein